MASIQMQNIGKQMQQKWLSSPAFQYQQMFNPQQQVYQGTHSSAPATQQTQTAQTAQTTQNNPMNTPAQTAIDTSTQASADIQQMLQNLFAQQGQMYQDAGNLQGNLSGLITGFANVLPEGLGSLRQMFSPDMTGIEKSMLSQAQQEAGKQVAGMYANAPGHSGVTDRMGEYMSQAGTQLAMQRQQNILPAVQAMGQMGLSGLGLSEQALSNLAQTGLAGTQLGISGVGQQAQLGMTPFQIASSLQGMGSQAAYTPMQLIAQLFSGIPYAAPVYGVS